MTNPWGGPPNNNSGNNSGNAGNNPDNVRAWRPKSSGGGSGGGGNGGNIDPAEIERMMRAAQARIESMLPGNANGRTGLIALLGLVLIIWLASGIYRVQENQIGVVLRFGEVTRTELPGLRYHLPRPIEEALTPNVTFENRIEIGFRSGERSLTGTDRDVAEESTMLTSDQNIIDLDFAVTWIIKDPQQYLFEIRDPENTVKKAAESAMREVIGQTEIQPALTEARDRIQRETKKLLQSVLDEYKSGVEIVRVELLRVNPPQPVVDAFNDVQRAEADRERLANEAEAYRNKIIPEARGEAERIKNEALGYRDQVVNAAKGDAERFSKVWQAYQSSRDVTAQRMYLETMEQIMRGTKKVIIDGDKGAIPYLPLPGLNPAASVGTSQGLTNQAPVLRSGAATPAPTPAGGQ